MKSIYIIDTSALLSDPEILFSKSDAELVIPQTVLSELDRLKVSRADRAMIYRGREVSRTLFSLAKRGKLTDGVLTKENSVIKVMSTDHLGDIPRGLNLKNADDVILALAHQVTESNPISKVVLITSDLNMLLRAQTLDVAAERIEEKPFKKSLRKRVQEERLIKALIAVIGFLLVVGIVSVGYYYLTVLKDQPASEQERNFQSMEQSYLRLLEGKPDNVPTMISLGNLYFENEKFTEAIVYYRKALQENPDDAKVRVDMAAAYLKLGNVDIALNELSKAMADDSQYGPAYYYAGVAFESKNAKNEAIEQFKAYLEIEPNGGMAKEANAALKRLSK
jgi:tetratricopeptide (TPR) repeat protein